MKCANCGAEIKLGCVYCSVCGKEAQIVPDYNVEEDILKELLEEDDKPDKNVSSNEKKKKSLKKTIYFNGKKQRYSLVLFVNNKAVKAEKIKWKSSKRTIVSVSKNGKLTVKKAGKVTITVKSNGITNKCKVTVKNK